MKILKKYKAVFAFLAMGSLLNLGATFISNHTNHDLLLWFMSYMGGAFVGAGFALGIFIDHKSNIVKNK